MPVPAPPPHYEAPTLQRMSAYREETSAGGLVVDTDGGVLTGALIGRLDRRGTLRWSLPKGHVEAGETTEETAVREVAEETGITGRVVGRLGSVDFWFAQDGHRIHKTVHHFLLRRTGGQLSDDDVEVTEVGWFPVDGIAEMLRFPDERELVVRAQALLAAGAASGS